jgi:8-oxo-dGTP pyrophosphatase MutT (NUDIX family)
LNITQLVSLHLEHYIQKNRHDPWAYYPFLRMQIRDGEDLQDRGNTNGHVTSSFALLNSHKTHLLMIYHLGLDKWLFPGGHYEGNVAPRTSALRELEEETGFPAQHVMFLDYDDFVALDIDCHEIPARPSKNEGSHLHHDFMYLGVANGDHTLTHQEAEVGEARWMTLDEASQLPDPRTQRVVGKIRQILEH